MVVHHPLENEKVSGSGWPNSITKRIAVSLQQGLMV
jgi:hypothetical protein